MITHATTKAFKSLVPSNHVKLAPYSTSIAAFGDKKHWLLVMEDSSNYVWRFFLKEKSDLAGIMLGLIKNLINKYNM